MRRACWRCWPGWPIRDATGVCAHRLAVMVELPVCAVLAGGRSFTAITPAIIADVGYLVDTKAPEGPYFEVAIIHHTDCDSTPLPTTNCATDSPSASVSTSGPSPTRPSLTQCH